MKSDSSNPLDGLLNDWANSRQADAAHTDRLEEQVLSATSAEVRRVANRSMTDSQPVLLAELAHSPQQEWGTKLMLGGGGVLTMFIIIGAIVGYNLITAPPITNASPPEAAILGNDVVAAKTTLVTEANAVFDNQLAWIAEHPREVLIEVDDRAPLEGEFVLVRVVVVQRARYGATWTTVWQTDVIARDAALVEIATEQLDDSSLAIWTHLISDGEVAVEMDLTFANRSQLPAETNTVLRPGQPTCVACSTENGVERCVYQTVMPLHSS